MSTPQHNGVSNLPPGEQAQPNGAQHAEPKDALVSGKCYQNIPHSPDYIYIYIYIC